MPIDCDERNDLRGQVRHERRLRRAFAAHPHPQDPDFPFDIEDLSETPDKDDEQ